MVDTTAAAAPSARKSGSSRAVQVVGWILRILLAAAFINAAVPKLIADPMAVAGFADLGGIPMLYTVGTLEVIGAVGLLIPILSGPASIGLTALLAIITVVTAVTLPPVLLAMPVSCLVVSSVLVYLQRQQTVRFARFARRIVSRG